MQTPQTNLKPDPEIYKIETSPLLIARLLEIVSVSVFQEA
jgi:hypothetical protein